MEVVLHICMILELCSLTSWLARAEMHVVRPFGNIETLRICHSDSYACTASVKQHLAYLSLTARFVVLAVAMFLC